MTLPDIQYPTFADTFALSGDYRFTTEPVAAGSANTLPTEVVTGLIDFIPRVPEGFTWYVENFQVDGQNEVQIIGFTGTPTAGSWKVGYPATGTVWSAAIPYTKTGADFAYMQGVLQGLSSIGAGNVIVTQDVTGFGDWGVEFTGALANTPVDELQFDFSLLTNSTVGTFTYVPGRVVAHRDAAITMDPVFNARIWEGQLCTIDVQDTPGFHLPAITDSLLAALALVPQDARRELAMPDGKLIYDVRHRNVVFAQAEQKLMNYAIEALPVGDSMVLTSPSINRLPYLPRPNVAA